MRCHAPAFHLPLPCCAYYYRFAFMFLSSFFFVRFLVTHHSYACALSRPLPSRPLARLCHFQFCILIIKFCLAKCKIRNRKKRKQQPREQQVQLVADGQTFCDADAGRGTHDYFVDDDNPGWQLCLPPSFALSACASSAVFFSFVRHKVCNRFCLSFLLTCRLQFVACVKEGGRQAEWRLLATPPDTVVCCAAEQKTRS